MLQETLLLGLGVLLGYMLSSFINNCAGKKRGRKGQSQAGAAATDDDDGEWESEEESEEQDDTLHGALLKRNAAPKKMTDQQLFDMFPIGDDLKMMLVVREDLKMGKGKIGAQCGHATLGSYSRAKRMTVGSKYWSKVMEKWSWGGQKKICIKVPAEADLLDVQRQC